MRVPNHAAHPVWASVVKWADRHGISTQRAAILIQAGKPTIVFPNKSGSSYAICQLNKAKDKPMPKVEPDDKSAKARDLFPLNPAMVRRLRAHEKTIAEQDEKTDYPHLKFQISDR
jgi:hypothetical protein